MSQMVENLKSKGQHRAAGMLARELNQPRDYGCHYGMRSDRAASMEAFYRGYDEYEPAKQQFQFVIMAQTTEVRTVTEAFADNFEANSYGHKLNEQLAVIGLRAKWGAVHGRGYSVAVPDNTKPRG